MSLTNGMPMDMPNYFGTYGAPMPIGFVPGAAVDQLYNSYKQALDTLMNYQRGSQIPPQQQQPQPQSQGNNAMGQRGTFIQVSGYKDVDNYPVPLDGTPTLFFDYEHMVFWSKKFVNGQTCVQSFVFGPVNSNGVQRESKPEAEEKEAPKAETQDDTLSLILEKLGDFSNRLEALESKSKAVE